MIAFDADVLSDILRGDQVLSERASRIPVAEQSVPVVVVEEILRGRLNSIRQAEGDKGKLRIEHAYELFRSTEQPISNDHFFPHTRRRAGNCALVRGSILH